MFGCSVFVLVFQVFPVTTVATTLEGVLEFLTLAALGSTLGCCPGSARGVATADAVASVRAIRARTPNHELMSGAGQSQHVICVVDESVVQALVTTRHRHNLLSLLWGCWVAVVMR